MSRKFASIVLALTLFSTGASANWWNVLPAIGAGVGAAIGASRPGYPGGYYAYAGQACSPYPQGPHCAPGLVCVGNGSGYNWGFGVCQPAYGYNPGWGHHGGGRWNNGGHCGNGGGGWRR